ncbi:MAG: S-layer protein [Candidatus Micrarchaeia archaeon]|jgi:hypothetical protein
MKTMSVQRIATVAAGAALVGAALAGAAVQVDTSGLGGVTFFSGGEPQVKVAIGSKAQPSDAVAAANIAAMIGNLAYVDQSLSVSGTGQLSCTGAAAGCDVDAASKKTTITVTTPGVSSANAYLMKTYILDNLDNQTEITKDASSSFDGQITSVQGWSKLVTKDHTAVLSLPNDGKVSNPKNLNVKQEQKVYLFAKTLYDTSTDYKQVIAQDPRAVYSTTFSDPLPLCYDTTKNRSSSDTCVTSDQLEQAHTKIKFLGADWVVTGYAMTAANTTTIKSVTIGKETGYNPYMNIDDTITAANGAKVVLKSVSPFGYGGSNVPYASFEVTSASGTVTTETLQTGEEKDVAGVTIHVNKVFPGVNNVNYADVSVYAEKLTLENNVQVDSSTHKYWYAGVGTTTSGSSPAIQNLSLYSTGDPAKQKFKAGDSYTLIRGTEAFKFTYEGLESPSTDTLSFSIGNNTLYTNASATVSGRFVQVTSGVSNAFQFGSTSVPTVYMALQNGSSTAGETAPSVQVGTTTYYYQNPTTGYYTAGTGNVTYYYSASENTQIGVSGFANGSASYVWVKEYNEDNQAGTARYATMLYDVALTQFVNTLGSTTIDKFGYTPSYPSATSLSQTNPNQEEGYITERGTKLADVSSNGASITYPKTVQKAKYTLTASGTTASAGKVTLNLGVGQSGEVDTGYTATVDAIDATATGGSSGASSVSGTENLKATGAKVAELNTASNALVVLDAAASGTETVIVVGGPKVNSAWPAGEALAAGADPVVKVSGSKVLVAGYTAADTTAAANELIAWLASNRGTVRG